MRRVSVGPAGRVHRDAAPPLDEPTARAAPVGHLGLLELQRTAGNSAVVALLAGARRPVLQRKLAWTRDTLDRPGVGAVGGSFEPYRNILAALDKYHTFATDPDDPSVVRLLEEIVQWCEVQRERHGDEARNAAVGKLLDDTQAEIARVRRLAVPHALQDRRGVARDRLWPSLRVRLGAPVEHRGKLGTVDSVPPQGAVPVRVDDQIIEVDPADLELIPIVVQKGQAKVTARWGKVFEVAPGIGVDVRGNPPSETFVDFIVTHLQTVAATPVGAAVLAQFDPREGSRVRTPPTGTGAYAGLSVIIRAPAQPVIETKSLRGMKEAGTPDFSGDPGEQIPWVKFPEPPQDPNAAKIIAGSSARVTTSGLEGHADFPATTEQFDVILFHEMIHAHLHSTGVTVRLRELGRPDTAPALGALNGIDLPGGANPEDSVEEALVVGIIGGKGVALSENAYRCQRGLTLRPSYRAVGINEGQQQVEAHPWPTVATSPTQIKAALMAVGLTEQQAAFVAGGR
jgi:hypothetical protein